MTTWAATRRSCNSTHPADSSAPAAAVLAAVLAAILWALASPNPPWVLAAASAGAVVGCMLTLRTPMTTLFGYEPAICVTKRDRKPGIAAGLQVSARRTAGRSGRDRARAISPAMRARSDAPGPGGAVLARVPVASHSGLARDTSRGCCLACGSLLPSPGLPTALLVVWDAS